MEYSEDVFTQLFLAIRGDQTSFRWLMENDYKELGAFTMALSGKVDAFKWLESNGFYHFNLIIQAAQKDIPSFKLLVDSYDQEYACLVGTVYQDKNCKSWLKEHSFTSLIDLAVTIKSKIN